MTGLRVSVSRRYASTLRFEGACRGVPECFSLALTLARRLQLWLWTRGVKADLVMAENAPDVRLERRDPYIYLELAVTEPGVLEGVLIAGHPSTLRALERRLLGDAKLLVTLEREGV